MRLFFRISAHAVSCKSQIGGVYREVSYLPRSLLIDTNYFCGRRPIPSEISASLRLCVRLLLLPRGAERMLIAPGVTEVGQQTAVKDVFLKSEIFPLLSRSMAKSVSPEMWGIKRPLACHLRWLSGNAFYCRLLLRKSSVLSISVRKVIPCHCPGRNTRC